MTKALDLAEQLRLYINKQNFYAKAVIGLLGASDSISIMAMPGGTEKVFMDGTRDKAVQIQINAKSNNQLNCFNVLSILFQQLEVLEDLPSANGSYDFESINITSLPNLITQDEQGFYIYALSISVNITIYEGAI